MNKMGKYGAKRRMLNEKVKKNWGSGVLKKEFPKKKKEERRGGERKISKNLTKFF